MSNGNGDYRNYPRVDLGQGVRAWLLPTGELVRQSSSYGGSAVVPVTEDDLSLLLTGNREPEEEPGQWEAPLLGKPARDWKVPRKYLRQWASVLARFDTEALAIYGRHRRDYHRWMAVVPQQECTGASVEVDDMGPAIETLAKAGYRRVGTIHTHPGAGTTASGTDTGEIWDDFGGIHAIVGKTSGQCAWYYSMAGYTWWLSRENVSGWTRQQLWRGDPPAIRRKRWNMMGADGGRRVKHLVREKTIRAITTPVGQGSGITPGRNTEGLCYGISKKALLWGRGIYGGYNRPLPRVQPREEGRGDWNLNPRNMHEAVRRLRRASLVYAANDYAATAVRAWACLRMGMQEVAALVKDVIGDDESTEEEVEAAWALAQLAWVADEQIGSGVWDWVASPDNPGWYGNGNS